MNPINRQHHSGTQAALHAPNPFEELSIDDIRMCAGGRYTIGKYFGDYYSFGDHPTGMAALQQEILRIQWIRSRHPDMASIQGLKL